MNLIKPIAGKAKTGIWGLDDILSGGFSRGHMFLVEGAPGTGKTTIALQFLMEGAQAGEKCLYITLSETEAELRDGAASHGWSLDEQIEVFTTRPDTLWGATFMVLAPEHPLARALVAGTDRETSFNEYLERVKARTEIDR